MNNEVKIFKDWYDSLTLEERKEFRTVFLKETGLLYPSFYSKLARSKFSLLEQRFIQEYAGENLDFVTEDAITTKK